MSAMKYVIFALIPLISCQQINFLSFEDVEAHLHDDFQSDYEVVSLVHTLHKRSLPSTMRIHAFQKDIELYLEPNDSYLFGNSTPVYLSYKGANESVVHKPFLHNELNLYHDLKNKAALVVEEKEDKHLVYGKIGDYMIRPLSGKNQSSIRNRRNAESQNVLSAKDNEIFADDHVLIKINRSSGDIPKEDQENDSEKAKRSVTAPTESDKTKKNRIYPEILVAADYNYFKKLGGDVNEFIKYQAVFWNAVDLLYRYFDNPEVRLNIAGIVISQESSADYYNETYVQGDMLNANGFLNSFMNNSIYDNFFPKISYDLVVALTNYTLTRDFVLSNKESIHGMAVTGSACNSEAVAVVYDLTHFDGVSTAAHELGHVFGILHDFVDECKNYTPKADYLMSYGSVTENQVRWSACSLKFMSDFFQSNASECLKNEPTIITSSFYKFLPGKITSLDKQCDNRTPGSKAYLKWTSFASVCHCLICFTKKGTDEYLHFRDRGALEGSPCENGGICLQGNCVPIPKHYDLY